MALAYPIMDVMLVFVLFRSVVFGSTRRPFHWLLVAAMTTMFVADFTFDLLALHNAYTTTSFVNALFLAEYVLIAAAALHPSVAGADRPGAAPDASGPPRRRAGVLHRGGGRPARRRPGAARLAPGRERAAACRWSPWPRSSPRCCWSSPA